MADLTLIPNLHYNYHQCWWMQLLPVLILCWCRRKQRRWFWYTESMNIVSWFVNQTTATYSGNTVEFHFQISRQAFCSRAETASIWTNARYCVIVNCGKKNGKGFRLLNRQTLCSYSSLSRVAGKHSMEQKNPIVVELRTSSVGSDEALWCIPGKIKSSFTNLPQIER